MAVVGSAVCGGNVCLQRRDSSNIFSFHNPNPRPCCFMVSNPQLSKPGTSKMLPLSSSSSPSSKANLQPLPKQGENKKKGLVNDEIDEWMRDSVAEIVKRLPESPLLVHVYSENNITKTRMEKAEENNWVLVNKKWQEGEIPMPDGVIFVDEIEEEEEKNEEVSRAWGIVVQGKGEEGCGAPACYLLKTSKSGSEIGLRCSHFCLVKVQSFRETAFSQLKNCWLLQGN
ncbi:hypothetical protein DITRI_Ditri18aG0006000 [Diplodiscus trichospermus]